MIELKSTQYNFHKPDLKDEQVIMITHQQTLSEVLNLMERFLKASGFCVDGRLEIVEDD